MRTARIIVLGTGLLATFAHVAAKEPSTLDRLYALTVPRPAPAQSRVLRVGSCSISCEAGSADNNCTDGQSCSCYCDGRGEAHCGGCQ